MRRMIDDISSRFRHYVRLESPSYSQDDGGDVLTNWVLEREVWADIQPSQSRENYQHGVMHGEISHMIYLRYTSDINEDWRIVYDDRVFEIQGIVNVQEANRILMVKAKEEKTSNP